jgi:hypothetical protein
MMQTAKPDLAALRQEMELLLVMFNCALYSKLLETTEEVSEFLETGYAAVLRMGKALNGSAPEW